MPPAIDSAFSEYGTWLPLILYIVTENKVMEYYVANRSEETASSMLYSSSECLNVFHTDDSATERSTGSFVSSHTE